VGTGFSKGSCSKQKTFMIRKSGRRFFAKITLEAKTFMIRKSGRRFFEKFIHRQNLERQSIQAEAIAR